ncbi:6-phosphogluconate dehydrogenase C-terminal domain-like protein [Tricharina praecox]|uniref:6-phosphogluconate dehydrogenase C-terminal domain-like protein n=1 Tax=Tricharina praecox TaxID=43433 RepID=UPI00222069EE|nr:6-phosphogluconate dehydrogenase C-terminal domain-like protein [Tricharina praecox]KAI5846113.1 6-phosphogluconate dehydrogenase C-terminal domain-like protein [Tricharina praecox]
MGTQMSLLLSEHNVVVSLFDVSSSNIDSASKTIDSQKPPQKIQLFAKDYGAFVASLDKGGGGGGGSGGARCFLLSITHGDPVDQVLDALKPHLKKDDVIIDGGNEWYKNTERRQKDLQKLGVALIGCGVSGGYQSARRGPSMSPGGDPQVLERILPQLREWCAKDERSGEPCVAALGPAGSGHYVKMVHNGIEQGMLGVLNESWEMLFKCLHTPLDEISKIFSAWAKDGELKNNYLVTIGADICGRKKEKGERGHILNEIQDKVVQDADGSEGTGVWAIVEAANRHVSAPTIAAAHFLRIASSNRAERLQVFELIGGFIAGAKKQHVEGSEKEVIEDLRQAVYCAFLASFVQGMNLLARANSDEGWNVKLSEVVRIWRNGCIIRSDYIADLIQPVYEKQEDLQNLLTSKTVVEEVKKTFPALKRTVARGLEWDAHMPSLSASMEYLKYCGGKQLPTQFMEAQLDYFGAHSYDKKCEGPGEVKKGAHHHEWKPA